MKIMLPNDTHIIIRLLLNMASLVFVPQNGVLYIAYAGGRVR